jgi:hypothetical protein
LEDAVVVDKAGRGFEEMEKDAVGLAAEEHEVEDLDEGWEPHRAGLFVFFKIVRSRVEDVCDTRSRYVLLYTLHTCEEDDISGMSHIGGIELSTSTPRELTKPRLCASGM